MNETMRSDRTTRPCARRARRRLPVPLALAALALLGAPALSAADGGAAAPAMPAQARAQVKARAEVKPGAKPEAKTETREVVVVSGPGDERGDGVWAKLLSGGYLGVELLPMTGQLRAYFGVPADQGVLISRVEEGSPAEKAGFEAGDVIVRVDEEAVATPWDLTLAVRGHEQGETARISVWRDGKPLDFDVRLEERERQKVDLGRLVGPGEDGQKIIRLRELGRRGETPPVVFLHPEAMERLGESLGKVDWPRLDEHLGERNRELEKRLNELEKRLNELEKELAKSTGKPK